MKECTKCKVEKNIAEFTQRWCKTCHYAYQKEYRAKNKDRVKSWQSKADKKYRSSDYGISKIKEYSRLIAVKPEILEYRKHYYLANKEKYRAREKEWASNNKSKIAYKASIRRAKVQKATFTNVTNEIKDIYNNCPKGYHVDHIIPLNHPDVCGLHVPWNLQYLSAEENLKKSNKIKELQNG